MQGPSGAGVAPATMASMEKLQDRYVRTGTTRTHYVEAGDGPPLVLLPGVFIFAQTYRGLISRLSSQFRTIVPDLPGSGLSGGLSDPWSFEQYADWTPSFLDALKLERATIVGHSNGGGVALVTAAKYPERIDTLVLVDTVGARASASPIGVLGGRTLDAWLEMELNLDAWKHVVYNLTYHRRTFRHQLKAAITANLLPYAPQIEAPTLLAWGRRDWTMPLDCAFRLQGLIPRSELYVSNASHDWLMTEREEFSGVVGRFVRQYLPQQVGA